MGLWDRLRALDERFVPLREPVAPTKWRMVLQFVGLVLPVLIVLLVVPKLNAPKTPPLDFECMQPEQSVVERILEVAADFSGGEGGNRQQTGFWGVGQRKVLFVTCTSLTPRDASRATPVEGDAGFVRGAPPLVVGVGSNSDLPGEIRFVHDAAQIVIELSKRVTDIEARDVVTSWLEQIAQFSD